MVTTFKQSKLTKQLTEFTIADLDDGEIGYCVEWAIHSDESGYLWINPKFPCSPVSHGTSHVKIKGHPDGIIVSRNTLGVGNDCSIIRNIREIADFYAVMME